MLGVMVIVHANGSWMRSNTRYDSPVPLTAARYRLALGNGRHVHVPCPVLCPAFQRGALALGQQAEVLLPGTAKEDIGRKENPGKLRDGLRRANSFAKSGCQAQTLRGGTYRLEDA